MLYGIAFVGGVLMGFLVAAMCSAAAARDACLSCWRVRAPDQARRRDPNLSDLGEEHNVEFTS